MFFLVIIFFEQARPQSEGSRHTDHGVKLPPDSYTTLSTVITARQYAKTIVNTAMCKSKIEYCHYSTGRNRALVHYARVRSVAAGAIPIDRS